MQKPAKVFQRVGDALQKMCSAFVKSAKAVRPQGLQNTHINIGIVVPEKRLAFDLDVRAERVEIMVEQLLTNFWRQVSLGIIQKGCDVILQSALAATLIVHKKGRTVAQHHVARLKIPVEKIITVCGEQKIGQSAKIAFQCRFAKRDSRKPQKIIFEIIQIPGDRLAVKTRAWVANAVIQIAPGFHLKTR